MPWLTDLQVKLNKNNDILQKSEASLVMRNEEKWLKNVIQLQLKMELTEASPITPSVLQQKIESIKKEYIAIKNIRKPKDYVKSNKTE